MSTHTNDLKVNSTYVLLTAAHNEEGFIEVLSRSIINQSVPPLKWVIVSDASTDGTDEIVKQFARKYPFIELLRIEGGHNYSFSAKVRALSSGYSRLEGLDYRFLGIVDADIALPPDYFGELLKRCKERPRLGVTGGFIYERGATGEFCVRGGNRTFSVAGATQFFRRECYEEIGGLRPLPYGGEDWCAEVNARMNGWEVAAQPDLKVLHYRSTGTAKGLLRYLFQQGRMDFSLGCLPAFEVAKCLGRVAARPFVLGAFARLAGYLWSSCRRGERSVSGEFVQFIRREQLRRLIPGLSKQP